MSDEVVEIMPNPVYVTGDVRDGILDAGVSSVLSISTCIERSRQRRLTYAHSRVRVVVDGARKRVGVYKRFSLPAPNWVCNGALANGLFVKIVLLRKKGIIGS